jgi:hypothetical protein
VLNDNEATFLEFVSRMEKPREYGDAVTLQAISDMLNEEISVWITNVDQRNHIFIITPGLNAAGSNEDRLKRPMCGKFQPITLGFYEDHYVSIVDLDGASSPASNACDAVVVGTAPDNSRYSDSSASKKKRNRHRTEHKRMKRQKLQTLEMAAAAAAAAVERQKLQMADAAAAGDTCNTSSSEDCTCDESPVTDTTSDSDNDCDDRLPHTPLAEEMNVEVNRLQSALATYFEKGGVNSCLITVAEIAAEIGLDCTAADVLTARSVYERNQIREFLVGADGKPIVKKWMPIGKVVDKQSATDELVRNGVAAYTMQLDVETLKLVAGVEPTSTTPNIEALTKRSSCLQNVGKLGTPQCRQWPGWHGSRASKSAEPKPCHKWKTLNGSGGLIQKCNGHFSCSKCNTPGKDGFATCGCDSEMVHVPCKCSITTLVGWKKHELHFVIEGRHSPGCTNPVDRPRKEQMPLEIQNCLRTSATSLLKPQQARFALLSHLSSDKCTLSQPIAAKYRRSVADQNTWLGMYAEYTSDVKSESVDEGEQAATLVAERFATGFYKGKSAQEDEQLFQNECVRVDGSTIDVRSSLVDAALLLDHSLNHTNWDSGHGQSDLHMYVDTDLGVTNSGWRSTGMTCRDLVTGTLVQPVSVSGPEDYEPASAGPELCDAVRHTVAKAIPVIVQLWNTAARAQCIATVGTDTSTQARCSLNPDPDPCGTNACVL